MSLLKNDAKKKRNVTEKQRANLKPIQKGQVLNPEGSRAHNPVLRALGRVSEKVYCEALSKAFLSTKEEMAALLENPEVTLLEELVGNAMLDAVKQKNYSFVERIADRLIGRIEDNLNIKQTGATDVRVGVFDGDKLKEAIRKLNTKV